MLDKLKLVILINFKASFCRPCKQRLSTCVFVKVYQKSTVIFVIEIV